MRINALIVNGNEVYVAEIPGDMDSFETIVEGEISIVDLPHGFIMVCNKERANIVNRTINGVPITGCFLIARIDENSKEIVSLSGDIPNMISTFRNRYITEEHFNMFLNIV